MSNTVCCNTVTQQFQFDLYLMAFPILHFIAQIYEKKLCTYLRLYTRIRTYVRAPFIGNGENILYIEQLPQ